MQREHNIDLTDTAAAHNRQAWDSYRRQRNKGLVAHRRSLAEEIQEGKLFLEERWIELLGNLQGKQLLDLGCGDGGESCCWARLVLGLLELIIRQYNWRLRKKLRRNLA